MGLEKPNHQKIKIKSDLTVLKFASLSPELASLPGLWPDFISFLDLHSYKIVEAWEQGV